MCGQALHAFEGGDVSGRSRMSDHHYLQNTLTTVLHSHHAQDIPKRLSGIG
jgi:hypothetical protein